ncbi:MAG: hypothetical protein WDZ49_09465 [Litorilinea sp.]
MNTTHTNGATAERTENTVFELITMASEDAVERESAEAKAAFAELRALTDEIRERQGIAAADAVFAAAHQLRSVFAHEMFRRGWQMRGNPDLLADLAEPG